MRRRILLAIVGVAAGSIVLLSLPLGIVAQRLYREEAVLSLEREATAAARSLDIRARSGDPVELPPSDDVLSAFNASGVLVGGPGPPHADAVVRRTLDSGNVSEDDADDHLVVAVPVLSSERVAGVIRISRSTADLSERVQHVRLALGGAALLIVLMASAAALALSRRLTRPMGDLADAAVRVGEGNMAARAPLSGIGELDVVAEALNGTVAKLGDLLARERASSANASHQLKTPLAALRLDLEARQLEGEEVARPLEQVERLERTIETLLAAARDAPADHEPFALRPLFDEVSRDWTGPLAELGRAIEIGSTADLPRVQASRAGVREILDVLVDNALRHGGGTLSLAARAVRGHLAIDVADEGPGISQGEAVFQRRSGAGHGIGLALARSLAEADGGRLDLTDARPGRTTFTLILPAASG